MDKIKKKYDKKNYEIALTKRDYFILNFINFCGWIKFDLIHKFCINYHFMPQLSDYENPITRDGLRVRLGHFCKHGFLKKVRFLNDNFFATTNAFSSDFEMINLNFNQAEHDQFLINFMLDYGEFNNHEQSDFVSQRAVRGRFKVGEKSGPIPDLIYTTIDGEDCAYIEYERTIKSSENIHKNIQRWLENPHRISSDSAVLVICETDRIYRKYKEIISSSYSFDNSFETSGRIFMPEQAMKSNGDYFWKAGDLTMNIVVVKVDETDKISRVLARARELRDC